MGRGGTSAGTGGPDPLEPVRGLLAAGLKSNADGRPAVAGRYFRRVLDAVGDGSADPDRETAERAYLRARALLGRVMSEFELRADVDAGLAVLGDADRWAAVAGADALRVAVAGQQGLLWLRSGDTARALAALDRAAARLGDAEPIDACRILLNRGSLRLELGEIEPARADLRACAELADGLGEHGLGFKARHNLGYAEFLAGDLPRALATMARAAESPGDVSLGVALADRAQVLLEAGLVHEADETLAQAAELFAAQRLSLDLAQAELVRSECALLLHRPQAALRWALGAKRRLARRGNVSWAARAELAELRARLDLVLDAPDRAACARIARRSADLAGRLEAAGSPRSVVRAAQVVGASALVTGGHRREAAAALEAAGRARARDPLTLALGLRAVRAELAFANGRASDGRREVRAGQRLLAAHRRQFGSVEAVTAAAVHGERLVVVESAAALSSGDAARVLDAVERGRATFAGPARVRPPSDPALAELLAELRFAVERERLLPPDSHADRAEAHREVERLRTAARQRSWHLDGEVGPPEAPTAARLVDELAGGDEAVVDLVGIGGQVHAVVVDGDGVRLHHLAEVDVVAAAARRVDADLRALAGVHLPDALRAVVRGSLERGLARLDELLLAPLDLHGPVQLAAGGTFVALPWGLLPSRRGLATSVGSRLTAQAPAPRKDGVLAVAGPGLTLAEDEAAAVARAWGDATVLAGAAAATESVAAGLRSAGVVHLAVHGRHEPDNPLFSWVRLADGPLFAHELEGADLRGSVVVLSACEVGRSTVRPGGEALGMASVLLRLGAENVVAALTPLRDDVAADLAPHLHAAIRQGVDPAAALAGVLSAAEEPVPLACFGARAGVDPGEV
ncbi:CHAT domain-containing protein [Actinotalea sp. M2MS4P-6]|uniref:CHAT domain-containing protein n=1 Tax=Actinotalea sp. M2MS4P-6 TaxID=2983762 RepID=UPI0021E4896D|nr:CHAT domain-containing protein [Actinotalea sp. M2MS4P-6]MCV2395580.1 CHAT domain-containing protein [Actinotalea sp. M2MS4P-6]